MSDEADVCLIVEGGYPYVLGGVASWMDGLMRASPGLTFHVISIGVASQPRVRRYQIPDNVVGITDVLLDACAPGRRPSRRDWPAIESGVRLLRSTLDGDTDISFRQLIDLMRDTGLGCTALLDSKPAWAGMQDAYGALLPNGSLVDFFWSWRFLAKSVLACVGAELPKARVFHAVATGYAGLVGAYAKYVTGRPFIVTEHGIYTNERRIELGVSEWLFDSGMNGLSVQDKSDELRDIWLRAFTSFSRISYALADVITTQYRANQTYQLADGASAGKLRIIPNGIDVDLYGGVQRSDEVRAPTVLMIGRIVPIKDIRTFIVAMSLLREKVPDVVGILIGPEEEDPSYAAGCRALVSQLGLETTVRFLGRVPDVKEYLGRADVIALTSISEAQPIALLEAAANGLPAVTTDVGSCREIIEGFADDPVVGRGGYVVGACDPRATADALAAILLDNALRIEMGAVMQKRIRNLYNKERIRRLYESLYESVTAGRAPAPTHARASMRARITPTSWATRLRQSRRRAVGTR